MKVSLEQLNQLAAEATADGVETYPLQTYMALAIKEAIANGYLVIAAVMEMQMGKTGIIRFLTRILENRQVWFLTAISDLDLREQNNKALSPFGVKIIEKFEARRSIDKAGMECAFQDVRNGDVICLDEAHFGTGHRALLNEVVAYLQKERGCVIVLITATPYEIEHATVSKSSIFKRIDAPTDMPQLRSNYWGVKEMLAAGKVVDIAESPSPVDSPIFAELVKDFSAQGRKYLLVRTPNSQASLNKTEEFIRQLGLGVDVIQYHERTANRYGAEFLRNPPIHPTVVLIKNFYRCGKVLEGKRNIYAVWESSASNVATTAQGLVGRMCGYPRIQKQDLLGTGVNKQALIYADKSILEEYVASVTSSVSARKKLAIRVKHIVQKGKTEGQWIYDEPRILDIDSEEYIAFKKANYPHNAIVRKLSENPVQVERLINIATGKQAFTYGRSGNAEFTIIEYDALPAAAKMKAVKTDVSLPDKWKGKALIVSARRASATDTTADTHSHVTQRSLMNRLV